MWRVFQILLSIVGVGIATWFGRVVVTINATTMGLAYLLLILTIASVWGFFEAVASSIVAALCFNLFFLPPFGVLTIADPENWIALFSFLATALVASRLSTEAKNRALDALARKQDVERLYTFSRAILLIEKGDPFPKQLVRRLADIFELPAAVLYERRSEEYYRAGPSDFRGLDEQLRDAALLGTSFADVARSRIITAVRLGSQPIAGLALQGPPMPDSVIQGISNLVAIGLERARAQDLAARVEAAVESERLRNTLLDAMAHEFKTPLTSVLAATSGLLDNPNQPLESRMEMLRIADEEAHHLQALIDDTVDMARLDSNNISLDTEETNPGELVHELLGSMRNEVDERPLGVELDNRLPPIRVDRRLFKLALKQLVSNALKYSPPSSPIRVRVQQGGDDVLIGITDSGGGIPSNEQARIFERLYRSPSVAKRIPGSGLGLSIAQSIARAHGGEMSVSSQPGETTFQVRLPAVKEGETIERGAHSGRR